MENRQIEIFKSDDGSTEIEVQVDKETVWLNQYQISDLFLTDRNYQIIPIESTKIEMIDAMIDEHSIDQKEIEVNKEDEEKSTKALFDF